VNNGFCQGLPQGSCDVQGGPVSWPQSGSRVIRGLW